jgi:hypothetical protein
LFSGIELAVNVKALVEVLCFTLSSEADGRFNEVEKEKEFCDRHPVFVKEHGLIFQNRANGRVFSEVEKTGIGDLETRRMVHFDGDVRWLSKAVVLED